MLTFNEVKKDWKLLCPEFKYLRDNVFVERHRYFLTGFELVRLPHGINEYSIYYQIFSLLRVIESIKKIGPMINYKISNHKKIRMDISLNQSREEHFKLVEERLSMIKEQFLFPGTTDWNQADEVLMKLDGFLDTEIFSQNRMAVFNFMLELSQFSQNDLGHKMYGKYFEKIVNYEVLHYYYTLAYGKTKEEYIKDLIANRNNKAALEENLRNNQLLISTLKGKIG